MMREVGKLYQAVVERSRLHERFEGVYLVFRKHVEINELVALYIKQTCGNSYSSSVVLDDVM